MLTSNRSATRLSRRSRNVIARTFVGGLLIGLVSCVDPQGRFDEFASQFPDARGGRLIDGGGVNADISGTFLLSINIPSITDGYPIRTYATVKVNNFGSASETLDLHVQFLVNYPNQPPGPTFGDPTGNPVDINGTPYDGSFDTMKMTVMLPPDSNSVNGQGRTIANLVLHGQTKSASLFCGTVDGIVSDGVGDLAMKNATFAAIATTMPPGMNLPTPVFACPP
jgi:hypothetical protein